MMTNLIKTLKVQVAALLLRNEKPVEDKHPATQLKIKVGLYFLSFFFILTFCISKFLNLFVGKDNSSSVPAASERPYKCERCENTYKLKKHLNRHQNQECDPNNFLCTLCKFKTNRHRELKTHLLEFHQIESSELPKFLTGNII